MILPITFTTSLSVFDRRGERRSAQLDTDEAAVRWRSFDRLDERSHVDVYVGYLRKKLGESLIKTVRGMGYRLEAR
jgi:DNA-binding response OmpR family regulator